MKSQRIAVSWLPVWLEAARAGYPATPASQYGAWVSSLAERIRISLHETPDLWGAGHAAAILALADETVAAVAGSLPPSAREVLRARDQVAVDSVEAAIGVWLLYAGEFLRAERAGGLERWRGERDAAAAAAVRTTVRIAAV